MVVKCLQCNAYSVFTGWVGPISRIGAGCRCQNQVWIDSDENIRAEDFNKVEVWNAAEQQFIAYKRFSSLCSTQKA